ncbi:hypothetical protein BKA70DRAFT_1577145 [Coprinopsis sp. MPI-PUGE-AT-0042]|nr:hypothetical protein BKA70DRAFT_1577145 [Coprinopsis sp. MPI-PUGE-AT-0042]
MGVVRKELHRQAEYLRALEAKNVKLTSELSYLRERKQSIKVLREEKLEAEVEAGRPAREAWAPKTLDTSSNNRPSSVTISVTQALTDLRITHATPSSSKSKVRLQPSFVSVRLNFSPSNPRTRSTRNTSRSSKRKSEQPRKNSGEKTRGYTCGEGGGIPSGLIVKFQSGGDV